MPQSTAFRRKTLEQYETVNRLRRDGLKPIEIATVIGVSRSHIYKIQERLDGGYLEQLRKLDEQSNQVGRCPTCGAKVVLPCLECAIQEKR